MHGTLFFSFGRMDDGTDTRSRNVGVLSPCSLLLFSPDLDGGGDGQVVEVLQRLHHDEVLPVGVGVVHPDPGVPAGDERHRTEIQ